MLGFGLGLVLGFRVRNRVGVRVRVLGLVLEFQDLELECYGYGSSVRIRFGCSAATLIPWAQRIIICGSDNKHYAGASDSYVGGFSCGFCSRSNRFIL